jgi:hypothetical protein
MSMWRAVVPAHPSYTRGAAVPAASPEQAPGLTQWELDPFASRSCLRFPPVCRCWCHGELFFTILSRDATRADGRSRASGWSLEKLPILRLREGSDDRDLHRALGDSRPKRGSSDSVFTRAQSRGFGGPGSRRAPGPPGASRCQGWCVAACPLVPDELALNRRGVALRGGRPLPCCLRLAGELGPGQRDRRKRGTY